MSNRQSIDTDSDVSELDPKELSANATIDKYAPQLGYAEDPESPLTADTFPSKSGGKPAWLNPEHILTAEDLTCGICEQPMILLLQLYTPEDQPEEAFHRTVYVFCCKKGACVRQGWDQCFKVFRSQLANKNPYYRPVESDGEDEEITEHEDFVAKSFKTPATCVICGLGGSKFCSVCGTAYCSREHQMNDWSMCKHKEFCKEANASHAEEIDHLRLARIFGEKEIVSEPEGKGLDVEEEEAQAAHFAVNNPGEQSDSKALVIAGDEQEEDTQVDVDDAFLQFQLRVNLYPNQVVRYERVEYDMPTREPLWVQDNYKPESIPACERCGGERTFEFQILSTLLNYLSVNHAAVDSLDWGSLYIYTCKENCTIGNEYAQEVIWKQDFSQDGVDLGKNQAKLLNRKNAAVN